MPELRPYTMGLGAPPASGPPPVNADQPAPLTTWCRTKRKYGLEDAAELEVKELKAREQKELQRRRDVSSL